ncbi:MAG: hypothetical protein HUK22_04665 [Thermoguttaceae bacterium]|nr:hypothetical protein [Thermoguttaceae bacterium]
MGTGQNFIVVLCVASLFAILAFGFFGLALGLPALLGKKIKRRCACGASREVMRLVAEREKAKLDAKRYRPETVNLADLPQISPELADLAQNLAQGAVRRNKPDGDV